MGCHIHARRLGILVATASLLVACGQDKGKPVPSQVVAKVNGQELSVHQVNLLMSRAGRVPPESVGEVRKQALTQLVDQEVLVQAALAQKLDRDPNVVQAVEQARREILARTVADQAAARAEKPDTKEIAAFYDQHPELFTERRVFSFQELSIPVLQADRTAFTEAVQGAKSIADVATWLKGQKIAFNATSAIRAAEQIPLELLPRFQKLKDGQLALMLTGAGATVVQLASSKGAPLERDEATPYIEQFLANRKRNELATGLVKDLRAKASIEYRGEFADAGREPPGQAAQGSPAQTPAAPPKAPDNAHIDRGIAGLK